MIIDRGTEHFVDEISGESDDILPEQEGDRDEDGDDDDDLKCSETAPSDAFRYVVLFKMFHDDVPFIRVLLFVRKMIIAPTCGVYAFFSSQTSVEAVLFDRSTCIKTKSPSA